MLNLFLNCVKLDLLCFKINDIILGFIVIFCFNLVLRLLGGDSILEMDGMYFFIFNCVLLSGVWYFVIMLLIIVKKI